MKLLGLDIGTKRVGVAVLVPPNLSPSALDCFDRAQGRAEREIIKIINEMSIDKVVAGLPLDENGNETTMSASVRKFCDRLVKRAAFTLEYIDEWGSSIDAKQRLNIVETNKRDRMRGLIDAEAASIILQNYLKQK